MKNILSKFFSKKKIKPKTDSGSEEHFHVTSTEKATEFESEEQETYSISLRVRRTICEDAYVSVPVTSAITMEREDGSIGVDGEALVAEAIRLSKDSRVEWKEESCITDPHPIQQARPEDRTGFDGFYEFSE